MNRLHTQVRYFIPAVQFDHFVLPITKMGASALLMPIHWGLFNLALRVWRQRIERITELADGAGIKLWTPTPGVPTEVIHAQQLHSDWWRQIS